MIVSERFRGGGRNRLAEFLMTRPHPPSQQNILKLSATKVPKEHYGTITQNYLHVADADCLTIFIDSWTAVLLSTSQTVGRRFWFGEVSFGSPSRFRWPNVDQTSYIEDLEHEKEIYRTVAVPARC